MRSIQGYQRSPYEALFDGFTLVELLVSTVISSLLVLLAVTMLGNITEVWKGSRGTADALTEGRSAMLVMRRDFDGRLREVPVFVSPRIDALDGLNSNVVAFFTTSISAMHAPDMQRSDVGMVVYYVAFTPDFSGRRSPKLFRLWLSPDEVWSRVAKLGWDPEFTPDPRSDEASGRAEILASNVLQYRVAGWDFERDDSGLDLVLRIVASGAAARLESEEDWSGATQASDRLFDADGETNDDPAVWTFRMRF